MAQSNVRWLSRRSIVVVAIVAEVGLVTVSKSSALLLLLSFNNQCTLTHSGTHFCKSNEIKCADNALTNGDEQREGVCGRETVV